VSASSNVLTFPGIRPASEQHASADRAEAAWLADWPRTSRLLPWSVAAFLVMLWLIPFDNTDLPVPLPVDATLDRPVLVVVALLWILSLSGMFGVERLRIGPLHIALFLFGLIAVVSLLLNFEMLLHLGELGVPIKKLFLLVSYGLLFGVIASALRPSEVPTFVKLMVGLASIMAIGVIVEYRTGFNAFYTWTGKLVPGVTPPPDMGRYDSIGRLTIVGPGGHPLAPAMMLSMALPFAVMGMISTPERRNKILYALAAAAMIGGAAATQRKTSMIVPAVSLLVLLAYRPRQLVRYLPLALVMAIVISVAAPGALRGVVNQLSPSQATGVLSTKDRVSDYGAILPEIVDHPLFGRGYESYDQKKYRILDNQYLSLVVNVGILGVLAYVGILATALLIAHRCARSHDPVLRRFGPAAVASFVGMAVGSELLEPMALHQLPYLFCIIAAFSVVLVQKPREAASRTNASGRPGGLADAH